MRLSQGWSAETGWTGCGDKIRKEMRKLIIFDLCRVNVMESIIGKYYWSISLGNIKRLRSVHVFVNYKSSDKPLKDLPPVRPYLADFTSHYLQTSRECFSLTRDFPMSRHFFLLWFLKQTNPRKLK